MQSPRAGDAALLGEVRAQALRSLKSYAQVKVEYGKQSESFDAAILMEYPDQLRIEVINDLGETVLRLIADGTTVRYENLREATSDQFAQSEPAFQKVFKLPLSVEEFISGLSGRFPDAAMLGIHEAPGKLEIELPQDRLGIDPALRRLLRWEKFRAKAGSGKARYAVDYSEYESIAGVTLPRQIIWQFFRPKVRLTVRLDPKSAIQFH